MSTRPVLGIDIGRVIIAAESGAAGGDTSFLHGGLAEALQTPPSDGAFTAIAALTRVFEGRVWLVSKAGPRVQERTRHWLRHHRFHTMTGVPEQNVRFCRERREKADHCRRLAITHFVDDRLDVLSHLRDLVPRLYLFGPQPRPSSPPWVRPVADWAEAERVIRGQV